MSDTFDLNAFIDGADYPTKVVRVYTNVAKLVELEDLQRRIAGVDAQSKPMKIQPTLEEQEALEKALAALRDELEKSALVFTFKGMPFRVAQGLADIFSDEEPATDEQVRSLVSKTIVKLEDSKGATSTIPDAEMLEKLRLRLSPPEYSKLVTAAMEVNFAAATYESEIDAGFPGGGADVE